MLCWMNGQYIDSNDLKISPFDHGFLYGLGFFETLRTYSGQAVFLQDHYSRLSSACSHYFMNLPYKVTDFRDIITTLNEAAGGEDGYFRINVSAGVHDIGLQPTEYRDPTVIVFRKPIPLRPRGQEKEAVWLKTVRSTPESDIRAKSHHYGNNVLGRMELPNLADYEGFFKNEYGLVAEGITSNIFWLKNDILYTPSVSTGVLPGITRQRVLHIAERIGMYVREGEYLQGELEEAHECFITNSVQELVPIKTLGDIAFMGAEGPVYQRLHQAYLYEISQRLKGE
ncbi:aminodeoxychorismate lyase [Lysinibacillus sp. 54212]|uniref:aminodeoxychorismate lyase n=1 Tax=Lysinibacillus sp. 54212 TaxID=3119829 RepID=UPI002FCB0509